MKKTVLNLRNMGFVLVAAASMFAISCGEEAATEEVTDATTETVETPEEVVEEVAACDMGDDTAAACEGGACEDGHSCDH